MEKQKKLDLIWKHTHPDFKGTGLDKTIMIWRDCGTCLVPLEGLTDSEIERLLPHALRKESMRQTAR